MKIKTIILIAFISAIANAQYIKLLDFSGVANGRNPEGSLFYDGTFLYGTAYRGGTSNIGTIFKIMPDGTGFSKLLNFAGASNGSDPLGSLFYDGNFLYGTTSQGGTGGQGSLFKIQPDGTGFVKLINCFSATGRNPNGSLIYDGTFLYGMTTSGGTNLLGTIFKVMPDGTGYSKLLDFAGTANGSNPYRDLIFDGTFLYGMTHYGGANDMGVIFKIKPDGTGYAKLLNFAGASNGSNPRGSLISDGTFLYGTARTGGANNMGVIFKIKPDGTGYVKLFDFAGVANGSDPWASLLSDGTFLYGTTYRGGTNNLGVIYKIKPDGTGFVKLIDFAGASNGSNPRGSLISDGTFLYGMTNFGGVNNMGTIFKYNPYCTTSTFSQSLTVCTGQSITVGSNTYSMSGTYIDILKAVSTCDSIVTTNLTVLPANTFTQSPTICAGQSVTVGTNTYTTSGTYIDTVTAVNTCDSIVTTNLTVENVIDISTNLIGATITANEATAAYQWIDCNNSNAPIASEINQSYTAVVNGDYAVIITVSSCSDTSTCVNISTVGVSQHSNLNTQLSVYPNPTEGKFQVSGFKFQVSAIEIYNLLGELVYSASVTGRQASVNLSSQPKGIYFLKVMNEEGNTAVKKIIIH